MATDPPLNGETAAAARPATRDELYAVLGIEPGASNEQVERAYRFCLELYGEGAIATYSLLDPAEAEEQRTRVREAYDVLADEEKRKAYDSARGFLPPEPPLVPFPAPAARPHEEPALPKTLSGAELRRIREARGVSLRHIATVTKIGLRFLEYIEEDKYALLPAPVYLRGFLHEYARLVGIDPKLAAEAYMLRVPSQR
jgi:flagellar biosynthesis protein FlhG